MTDSFPKIKLTIPENLQFSLFEGEIVVAEGYTDPSGGN
jgi:hypothetical protein